MCHAGAPRIGTRIREKPCENALVIEFEEQGVEHVQQPKYPILYHRKPVGDCQPDLMVGKMLVVDCKSIPKIGDAELAQMLTYLRITKKEVGLILNFYPPSLEFKRVVL